MQKNEVEVFDNENFNVRVMIDEKGNYRFDAESVARSLGFVEQKNGKEYVRWRTVNGYLKKYVSQEVAKGSYIPESMVYKLAFKANNEIAENFQDWIADEVLPSLRKTGSYEMPNKEKPKQKNLSSANMLVKTVSGIFKDAGVSPLYIAAEAKRLYKEQADIDINIPLITDSTMPKLYDCTEIAKEIGIMSTNGNPHIQAVSAILSKIDIASSEIVTTAFSRNGHDDVTIQYKPSVYEKVKDWLQENNYPEKIPYVNSKGAYKTYSVVYAEVA